MEISLFLPQMRMSHEAIVERARAAETAGFEGIAFMDHLAPPLAAQHDMWEAITIAGWVLAHTTDLGVSHLVLCDSLRHPAVLAREVVTLDHASGGRFELGIGWGSVPAELETFGVGSTEAPVRVGRLAESLDILRRPVVRRTDRPPGRALHAGRRAAASGAERPHPDHDRRHREADPRPRAEACGLVERAHPPAREPRSCPRAELATPGCRPRGWSPAR